MSARRHIPAEIEPCYNLMQDLRYTFRMTKMQAALGSSQLQKLAGFMKQKVEIVYYYDNELKASNTARVAQVEKHDYSSNHLHFLRAKYDQQEKTRNRVIEQLARGEVHGLVHYITVPIHPYYQEPYPTSIANYQEALNYYREALNIAIFPSMTETEINTVVKTIKNVIGQS